MGEFPQAGTSRRAPASWYSLSLDAGRQFDVEVYLGPNAGRDVRPRVDRLLDSLRIASGDYFHPEPVVSRGSVRVLDREHSL